MARTAPVKGGGQFPIADTGPQVVRCFAFIDLGTQTSQYQGKEKIQHKVLFGFEVCGTEKGGDYPGPFTLWKRFTFSMHEKAALRKFLASWRGKPFTDEEAESFDVVALAERGTPGLANVVHNERDGNFYANIDTIMPLPKGMQAPERVTPPTIFDLDNYDDAIFSAFSDNLKATIKASPEYQAMFGPKASPANKPAPAFFEGDNDGFSPPPPDDDDVPF